MPELPEMEAWRRALDDPVSRVPDREGGPGAHRDAEDVRSAAVFARGSAPGRRASGAPSGSCSRPTTASSSLLVHLMSAGRIRYLRPGEKGPKTPAFRLRFQGGGELVLTEGGPKKRAGVWLLTPEAAEAELAHLGPEALGLGAERLGEILQADSRRLHSLLRDQRAIAGIGRAWANEILRHAQLSPFALSRDLSPVEVERLSASIDEELARGLELRERGAKDAVVYRVHNRLGEPCPECGTPIARVDFEEHTIYYCPALPDRRSAPQGPPPVAPAQVVTSRTGRSGCMTRANPRLDRRARPSRGRAARTRRSRRPAPRFRSPSTGSARRRRDRTCRSAG